jgi:TolB-like protein/DNA-binding winged helix-turn-helix (wHTH) protein/Flp pilus assembly protein TadD
MDRPAGRLVYEFADFQVDAAQRQLLLARDRRVLPLASRAFETLLYFVEHPGELLDKPTLMKAIWPSVVVEENNLNQCITALRRVLGESRDDHRFIVTVPGRGYRFVAEVRRVPQESSPNGAQTSDPTAAVLPIPVRWGAVALVLVLVGGAWWWVARKSTDATSSKRAAPAAAVAQGRTSVAVLPFVNLTGDANKDYLGDGMAEELINTLTQVSGLKVPARTSSFSYKGRSTDIRQIARDLGVGTIVEGSVRSAGKEIRITAQLIDGADGTHLWSQTYDREFTDLFKLQDELATTIEQALQLKLSNGAPVIVTRPPQTQDLEAYQLTLQGFSVLERPSSDLQTLTSNAMDLFQKALARDPKYALAYAGMANMHLVSTAMGKSWKEGHAAAEQAAQQALALDPNSAQAEAILAQLSAERNDWVAMEAHYRRATALDPNDGWIKAQYSWLLAAMGHQREAQQEVREAYTMAPANPWVVSFVAFVHSIAGLDTEALKFATLAAQLDVPSASLAPIRAWAAVRAGHYDEYAKYLKDYSGSREAEDFARASELTQLVYAAVTDPAQRPAALAARARLYPRGVIFDTAPAATFCAESASAYAVLGAIDMAYDLQNQCLDQTPEGLSKADAGITPWGPEMRSFRRDKRFQALVTRIGVMPYFEKYGPPDDCELKDGTLTCH